MQSYINVKLDGSSSRGESSLKRRTQQELRRNDDSIKGAHERLKYFTRKLVTFLFSQVGVGALLMCYTILGATIFINLESVRDTGLIQRVESLRSEVVAQLWNVTHNYNIIYNDKWQHEVDLIVRNFQTSFLQQIRRGYTGEKDDPWTFPKALMYSLSVYTTIGYGNLTPRTDWGKAITCIYALFGIPLLLLYMANIGDLLATSFREFYMSLERCKRRVERSRVKSREEEDCSRGPVVVIDHQKVDRELNQDWILIRQKSQEDKESNEWRTNEVIPISTCLGVFFCYIVLGSIFFSWWEGWNYLDGSYFCIVTLLTIGFADFIPGQTLGQAQQQVDGQLILLALYILFGMALIACVFHLTQERFFISAKKLGRALHLI